MSTLFWLCAIIIILLGVLASLFPLLPAVPLTYLGLYWVAWMGNFSTIGPFALLGLAMLVLFSIAIDCLMIGLKVKRRPASYYGVIGALLGASAGALTQALIWFAPGAWAGAVLGEVYNARKLKHRLKLSAWCWIIFGIAAKLAIILLMLMVLISSYT